MLKILNKKDRFVIVLIGVLIGAFALVPLKNLGLSLTPALIIIIIFGCGVFAFISLTILALMSKRWTALHQFARFAAVGTLNALLDLGILNFLIFVTDISVGIYFTVFKTISAFAGKNNSYFWNKLWTFESDRSVWRAPVVWEEYVQFMIFTFIGLVINVGIASTLVNFIAPPGGMDIKLWANIASVVAMLAAMMWNFLSYRHIVFKSKEDTNMRIHTNDTNSTN